MYTNSIKRSLTLLFILLQFTLHSFSVEVYDLTCEMMRTPLAVNVQSPRFGWKLISANQGDYQTAYQIIVRSESGEIWNSGKVKSGRSQMVIYRGKTLKSDQTYTWNVKIWDSKGNASESKTSFFEIAPNFSASRSKWIGAITREQSNLPIGRRDFHGPSFKNKEYKQIYDKVDTLALRSIMLRKEFRIEKQIKRAIIHISGLGHYNLSINGQEVSKDIFTPVWSDYDKTVYYNTYKVDSLLQNGLNSIGVVLGNGFYNAMGNRYRKLWVTFGPPTLFTEMQIDYTDGTSDIINSDTTWKYDISPTVYNDIYGGEDYDARCEQAGWNLPGFDSSKWKQVVEQGAPKGILRPQELTGVRIREYFSAQKVSKIDSSYVLDMGQNLAGFPTIKVIGKKGQSAKLTVGEQLNEQTGKVSQKQSGSPHFYTYTLKGEGIEEWHPQFSFYGFRYIQIDGAEILSMSDDKPSVIGIQSDFIYNSTDEVGSFECSNEIFNKAHILIKNAVKSNMQSVFMDCPHREKLGWLEETHLMGPCLLYNWDLTQFYPKIMRDIADRQNENGFVPTIVPEYVVFDESLDVFHDSPEWGIASIMIPWLHYKFYGDDTLIREYYNTMKGYVNHMTSRATDHIVSHGLGDWYDYGEHRAGFSKNSPVEVSATAHYYYAAHLVAEAAKMLNKSQDEKSYSKLADDIKSAFNERFFHPNSRQYGSGSQFCNAIAIYMNLVDPKYKQDVLNNLKSDIAKHGNRLTTGDVGNRYLFQALALNGENELMYLMHNHEDAPGYGFQLKFGATTLTEQWDPRKGASWNHFMMGQIDEWFFGTLAGIKPAAFGFKDVIIEPTPVGDLTWVKAHHRNLYGDIKVDWTRENNRFILKAEIPVNTDATIILPNKKIHKVGSGNHTFECNIDD